VKQLWQAEDGKVFESEEECKNYEYENELNKKNEERLIREKFFPDSTEPITEEDRKYYRNFIKDDPPQRPVEEKLKIFKDNLSLVEIIADSYSGLNKEEYLKVMSEGTRALSKMVYWLSINESCDFSSGIVSAIEAYLYKKISPFTYENEFFPIRYEIILILGKYSSEKSTDSRPMTPLEIEEINQRFKDYLYKYLSPLQAKVIIYRYGLEGDEPCSLTGVGRIISMTRDRVRNLERDAMFRLDQLVIYSKFMYQRGHFDEKYDSIKKKS